MPSTLKQVPGAKPLRYFIGLGGVPWRMPIEGDEPFLRPEVGFTPAWFRKYCDIDFSSRWHHDPDYRLEAYEKMRAEVRRRFPGRDIGCVMRDQPPDLLSGLLGTCWMPHLFGQELQYFSDNWPAGKGDPYADNAKVDAVEPLELDNNPVFQNLLRQCDRIETLTGSLGGQLNWQGVLNTAFRLRGQQIFLDLIDSPQRAHRLFECITTTMVDGMKKLYERQRRAGVDYQFGSTANCVVNMLSPELYVEHLLPFDLRLRSAFESFGLHNCAWVVDPYLDAYANIPALGYIDMGVTSDLVKAKRLFPDARRTVLYTAMELGGKSEREIREDFVRIAREYAPCDVGLPNIDVHIPDERVEFVLDLCDKFSREHGL